MPDLSLYDGLYLALTLRDRLKGYDLHLVKGIVEALEAHLHLSHEKIKEAYAELASGGGHDLEDVMRGLECHRECSEEDLEPPGEAVLDTVEHHRRTVLRGQAAERFLDMLENPPEPNEALKEAVENYRKLVAPEERKPLIDTEEAVSWLKPEHFEKIGHEHVVEGAGKTFEGQGSLVGPEEFEILDRTVYDEAAPALTWEELEKAMKDRPFPVTAHWSGPVYKGWVNTWPSPAVQTWAQVSGITDAQHLDEVKRISSQITGNDKPRQD
jgi:hypothetical protein